MFLVDTDVVSETSPLKREQREEALDWLRRHGADIFLSAITVAEIWRGVALLDGMGQRRKAAALHGWASGLTTRFGDRILPVSDAVGRRAGELFGASEARGHKPGIADACIGATGDLHGLVVVTYNVRHFGLLNVRHRRPNDDPAEPAL